MVTVQRNTVELDNGCESFFARLQLDTEQRSLSGLGHLYSGHVDKPWVGKVDANEREFEISRLGVGIMKVSTSIIVMKGKEVRDGSKRRLEISYSPSLGIMLSLILGTIFSAIIPATDTFDLWGIAPLSMVILHLIIIALDLKKSDKELLKYVKSARSNASQQST
jgi:hypothetical protein